MPSLMGCAGKVGLVTTRQPFGWLIQVCFTHHLTGCRVVSCLCGGGPYPSRQAFATFTAIRLCGCRGGSTARGATVLEPDVFGRVFAAKLRKSALLHLRDVFPNQLAAKMVVKLSLRLLGS